MQHLIVTAKKVKSLYTRQKAVQQHPGEDVTKTVDNFFSTSKMKMTPALQHGVNHEGDAKKYYVKAMKKKIKMDEPGLVLSGEHGWVGASPDGIRKCSCCPDTSMEIKCPFKGYNMGPKDAFLLDTVSGKVENNGNYLKIHLYYFQVQTGTAVCNLTQCDFIVFTIKGIHIVKVSFDKDFWNSIIDTVKTFYITKLIRALLLELRYLYILIQLTVKTTQRLSFKNIKP